jgi:hypothetical protein
MYRSWYFLFGELMDKYLADIAAICHVNIRQLPPNLTPVYFGASDYRCALEYSTVPAIRQGVSTAWDKYGYKIVCPECKLYARRLFFLEESRVPNAGYCDIHGLVWGNGVGDDEIIALALKYRADIFDDGRRFTSLQFKQRNEAEQWTQSHRQLESIERAITRPLSRLRGR